MVVSQLKANEIIDTGDLLSNLYEHDRTTCPQTDGIDRAATPTEIVSTIHTNCADRKQLQVEGRKLQVVISYT